MAENSQPQPRETTPGVIAVADLTPEEAEAYWTEERKKQARPLPMPMPSPPTKPPTVPPAPSASNSTE